jgi:hypothetical protein
MGIYNIGKHQYLLVDESIQLHDWYVVQKSIGGYCEPVKARDGNEAEWNGPFKSRIRKVKGTTNHSIK